MARKKGTRILKIGRPVDTSRFIPVAVARKRKKTAVVETIRRERAFGWGCFAFPNQTLTYRYSE